MKYYLAVDIGASSGRHILGFVQEGKIVLEEVYRFDNQMAERDDMRYWDTDALFGHIVAGMKECAKLGKTPVSMGVDTWGVDFVLLDENDQKLGEAVAYRDDRTVGMDRELEKTIPYEELYAISGIHKNQFNTIYQLAALQRTAPQLLQKAKSLLFMPDYFHFLLTGKKSQEYTEASTSGLLNAAARTWDEGLLDKMGLPKHLFGPLSQPGTVLGELSSEIAGQVGFSCQVVLPATHDTGSAYLSVPAKDENAVYISSGTWSLLGIETESPITSGAARKAAFTNEGGYGGTYRFLQNIMGLWMVQSIRREYDKKYSYAQLEEMAKEAVDFTSVVDVNDNVFLAPKSMQQAVKDGCAQSGQPVPETLGQLMQCVYISLAQCYARAVKHLQEITGKTYTSINIVGGGSKDTYLNQLTANATGLPVYAGPQEGTVIGNLLAQMIGDGVFASKAEARKAVAASFNVTKVEPK